MSSLTLLFPMACVAYFGWKSLTSRVFLLGIPFLQYLRQSVFFDEMRPFWLPGRLGIDWITLGWLVLVWLLCTDFILPRADRRARRPFGGRFLPEEIVVVAIAVLVAVSIASAARRYGDLGSALHEAFGMVSMLIGYVLLRGILSQSSRAEVFAFMKALVVVNTAAAVLFIVHQGLHIHVYQAVEYFTTTFRGEVITRTFTFMPPLLFFSLAMSFALRRWSKWVYIVVLISLVAIWLSYTRTMLAIAILMAVVPVVVRMIKGGQSVLVLRRSIGTLIVVASVAAVLLAMFPTQSRYFMSRIESAMSGTSVSETDSLTVRRLHFDKVFAHTATIDPVLGVGFASAAQDPGYLDMQTYSADSIWVRLVYTLGIMGLVLFAGLIAAFALRAAWMARSREVSTEYAGLVWLPYFVGMALGSFIGAGALDPTRWCLNLFPFAFLAAEAARSALLAVEIPGRKSGVSLLSAGGAASPSSGEVAQA
jgi:hypothetical protein